MTANAAITHVPQRSILVVDDDPDAREILVRILEKLGQTSRVATNGREALSRIAEELPSLIFLDLMMPEMSGFEAMVRIKREINTRNIPVVIVSAMGSDQRLTRLGASHVMPKGSVNVLEVKKVLAQIFPVSNEGSSDAPAAASGPSLDLVAAEAKI